MVISHTVCHRLVVYDYFLWCMTGSLRKPLPGLPHLSKFFTMATTTISVLISLSILWSMILLYSGNSGNSELNLSDDCLLNDLLFDDCPLLFRSSSKSWQRNFKLLSSHSLSSPHSRLIKYKKLNIKFTIYISISLLIWGRQVWEYYRYTKIYACEMY